MESIVYPQRYYLLVVYCIISVSFFFQIQVYPTIGDVLIKFYGVSYFEINLVYTANSVGNLLLFYPFGKFVKKYGLRVSMIFVSFMIAIGSVMKCFSNHTELFALLAVGEIMVGCLPFLLYACLPVIASAWFKCEESAIVLGSSAAAAVVGQSLAFLLPSIVAKTTSTLNSTSQTLFYTALAPAIISCVTLITCVIVFKDKPPTPPSLAEERKSNMEEKLELRLFLRNKNAVLICISFALVIGLQQLMLATLNQSVLSSFEDNQKFLTISGILFCFAGIPGSFLTGFSLRRQPKYKLHHIVISGLIAVVSIIYVLCLWIENVILLYLSTFTIGMSVMAVFVLLMDYLLEVTYPFPECLSFNLMQASSLIPTIALIPILTKLLSIYGAPKANILLIPISLLNVVLSFFVDEDLRRKEADEETLPILTDL